MRKFRSAVACLALAAVAALTLNRADSSHRAIACPFCVAPSLTFSEQVSKVVADGHGREQCGYRKTTTCTDEASTARHMGAVAYRISLCLNLPRLPASRLAHPSSLFCANPASDISLA